MNNYCEFIGDDKKDAYQIPKDKRICPHVGLTHCTLSGEILCFSREGWRMCAENCTQPFYSPKESKCTICKVGKAESGDLCEMCRGRFNNERNEGE